ncbi:hypothetical protein BaRGS_00036305, partial [Batillaria attramentaria]
MQISKCLVSCTAWITFPRHSASARELLTQLCRRSTNQTDRSLLGRIDFMC